MSHDIHAAWVASEIATLFKETPEICFERAPKPSTLTVYAAREGREKWPVSDGVIVVEAAGQKKKSLALEFKRTNEGLHGVLTALGQAHAYIHKGFGASVIAIPKKYESHDSPGKYLDKVMDRTAPEIPIGVFSYDEPDPNSSRPFKDRLFCHRQIKLDRITAGSAASAIDEAKTQWAHLREGSSDPDAFYKYLRIAKTLPGNNPAEPDPRFPQALVSAAEQLSNGKPILKYLSNSHGDTFHDKAWRHFWFSNVLTPKVMVPWNVTVSKGKKSYEVNDAPTRIMLPDGSGKKKFFSGRSDSIKNKIVGQLNSGEIGENEAWRLFAGNIYTRAHSYREDIDSGLFHLGLIDEFGKPTETGYKFVDACDRNGDSNSGTPRRILSSTILKNGQLDAFLHYVFRLSEEKFKDDSLAFSTIGDRGRILFDKNEYLDWLEEQLATNLKVMRKVSERGGAKRKPFQAELAILRQFGFVEGFRNSVGLEINWPSIQQSIDFTL